MMTETKRAKVAIKRCFGKLVCFVEIAIDADIDEDSVRYEYTSEALDAAGITNYTCDGCYDQAYRVKFVEWVETVDYVADYVI